MDINPSSLANREIALNQANVGQEIHNKTLEKAQENKKVEEVEKTAAPKNDTAKEPGLEIDIYA